MKKLICFSTLILIVFCTMAQGNILLGVAPEAKRVSKQEKELLGQFEATKCFKSSDDFSMFFIYTYDFEEQPSPELFLEGAAIEKLKVLYRKEVDFPISYGVIFNQDQEVVGNAEESNVFCYHEKLLARSAYQVEKKLLDYQLQEKPDRILRIDTAPSDIYFAEKDKELRVLLFDTDRKMEVLEMKEFIACCWEDTFPKEILELQYPRQ
ncbi:MAG: hypothetical protein R8G66_28565 [Cytophagales bacterium]|nr:hypothetical protein [Cytophagales bacterium]